MTGEHWKTRLWWSVRRTVKWANTVVEMLWAIVMLHSARRYKEKLISSQAWWGSRQWKEILLQDRQYVEQQRDRHGTGRINALDWRGQEQHYWWLVVVWPTLLILTRGWWPVVLCGDTRVVYSTTTVSQWRAMTHRISVSVTQICNCVAALPCLVSILASRHFFPAITERNSSLCDGLNVWPFLAFWHCQPESSLIIYKAEN